MSGSDHPIRQHAADSSGLRDKLAACYVRLGDKELQKLFRLLPGVSAQQYVNGHRCAFDSLKNDLANSLTEIGMPCISDNP
jgi:hypothetical protein